MQKKKVSLSLFVVLLVLLSFTSCTYKERVQPITLPAGLDNSIVVHGVWIAADAYADPDRAREAFGFDIREAGLLPVQVVLQNDGNRSVTVLPEQTFLIDAHNQAWPVNTLERTYRRVEDYTEVGETVAGAGKPALLMGAAGAIAGLAIGIVTGENVGEAMGKGAAIGAAVGAVSGGAGAYQDARVTIRQDLSRKALHNRAVLPNQIGYGMLFFPGFTEEAQDATQLRLTLSFAGVTESVTLFLPPLPAKP